MKTQRDTPKWLADKMAMAAVSNRPLKTMLTHILEPSAGTGILIDSYLNFWNYIYTSKITCVELNKEKCEILKSNYSDADVIHGNFLAEKFNKSFDVILAAPPFINNSDVLHIAKMYSLLNQGGVIVTLTTPFWTVNNEIHQVEFRKFLEGVEYKMEMLPDNTFIEKGKTVPTAILVITKPYPAKDKNVFNMDEDF